MKLIQQVSLARREELQTGSTRWISVKSFPQATGRRSSWSISATADAGRRCTTARRRSLPWAKKQAERIFRGLVASKIDEGYSYAAGSNVVTGIASPAVPAAPEPAAISAAVDDLDARAQAVLRRLAEGHTSTSSWRLSRAVWRAGELQLRAAEPLLMKLLGTGTTKGPAADQPLLDYCIVASLACCGSELSIGPLQQLMSRRDAAPAVARMASEACLRLLDEPRRSEFIGRTIAALPPGAGQAGADGPRAVFHQRLAEHLDQAGQADVLVALYRIDNTHVRPAVIETLRTAPLSRGYFQSLRRLFKLAELRRDAEVFGLLARALRRAGRRSATNATATTQASRRPSRPSSPRGKSLFARDPALSAAEGLAHPAAARRVGRCRLRADGGRRVVGVHGQRRTQIQHRIHGRLRGILGLHSDPPRPPGSEERGSVSQALGGGPGIVATVADRKPLRARAWIRHQRAARLPGLLQASERGRDPQVAAIAV